MSLKYSLILKAVDKISGPARKVEASVRKMGRSTDQLKLKMALVERTAQRRGIKTYGDKMEQAGFATGRFIRKIGQLPGRLKLAERSMRAAGRAGGWMGKKLLGALGGAAKWGGLAAVGGAGFALFDMFKVAGQFEQFQIMLEGTEGSAAKAEKAMSWVKKFAETTPYELNEVMEAFVQLKAYGIDPMDGSLRSIGDASSSMSKGIMEGSEALADAMTGEFERLKSFGITTRQQGDKVTFNYVKNGKAMQVSAAKTASAIEAAVTGIWNDNYAGGMDRQATTMFGIISNLKDKWTNFQVRVAKAGIFDKVKQSLERLLEKITRFAEDGTLERWAQKVSDWLGYAFDKGKEFVTGIDWPSVGKGMGAIVKALVKIIGLIGKAATAWSNWQLDKEIRLQRGVEDSWFASYEEKKRARAKVFDLEMQRHPSPKINGRGRTTLKQLGQQTRRSLDHRRDGWGTQALKRQGWGDRAIERAHNNRLRPTAFAGPRSLSPAVERQRPQQIAVSGRTVVELIVPRDVKPRIRQLRQEGDVPMTVKLGRSNAGAA